MSESVPMSAAAILAELLAWGPRPAREVAAAAKARGIPERTLDRTRRLLHVRACKSRLRNGPWLLHLPGHTCERCRTPPAAEAQLRRTSTVVRARGSPNVGLGKGATARQCEGPR